MIKIIEILDYPSPDIKYIYNNVELVGFTPTKIEPDEDYHLAL